MKAVQIIDTMNTPNTLVQDKEIKKSDFHRYTLTIDDISEYVRLTMSWIDPTSEIDWGKENPYTSDLNSDLDLTIVNEFGNLVYAYTLNGETPEEVAEPKLKVKEGIEEEFVLIENYGKVLREARERLGLDRKELGKRIGEKESVLKRVEEERMRPDEKLLKKLQKALGVELLKKVEGGVRKSEKKEAKLTLGDVIVLRTE